MRYLIIIFGLFIFPFLAQAEKFSSERETSEFAVRMIPFLLVGDIESVIENTRPYVVSVHQLNVIENKLKEAHSHLEGWKFSIVPSRSTVTRMGEVGTSFDAEVDGFSYTWSFQFSPSENGWMLRTINTYRYEKRT